MSRFKDTVTEVVFSVDDSKDDRYAGPRFEQLGDDDKSEKKPARKTSIKSDS